MTPAGQQSVDQGELDSDQRKKKRKKKRKSKSKKDEAEFDDEIILTVVMKGWGALSAYDNLSV